MAPRHRISTTVGLIYLLSLHHIHAFAFNQNSGPDQYDLAEAIRALELRKNGGYDPPRGYDQPELSYRDRGYTPNDSEFADYISRMMDENRARPSSDRTSVEDDIRQRLADLMTPKDSDQNSANERELESIFNEDDENSPPTEQESEPLNERANVNEATNKREYAMPLEIPAQEGDQAEESSEIPQAKIASPKYLDLSGLNEEQARRIMAQVDQIRNQEEYNEENEDDGRNSEEVSQDELEDVFDTPSDENEIKKKRAEPPTLKAKKSSENTDIPESKQETSYNRLFTNQINKRSAVQSKVSKPSVSIDLEKLFDIIAKLRLKERLESREINFLSDSLNGATSSQIHQTVNGLQDELTSIEKAIAVEKALERVDAQLSDQDKRYLDLLSDAYLQDERNSLINGDMSKRRVPDVQSENGRGDGDDGLDTQDIRQRLTELAAEKAMDEIRHAQQERPRPQEKRDGADVSSLSEVGPPYAEYPPQDEGDPGREGNTENIRRLLSGLDRDELANAQEAIQQYEENTCPELESLSDACAVADDMGVAVDDEARDLCSRHETCYACSFTLQKSSHQCDEAYSDDADRMCDGDDTCMTRALAFLGLIRHHHRVGSRPFNACLSGCVVDYIFGVDDRSEDDS